MDVSNPTLPVYMGLVTANPTNVRDLNIKVDMFPSNLIARMFNFAKKEFFDIDDSGPESQPVEVKF